MPGSKRSSTIPAKVHDPMRRYSRAASVSIPMVNTGVQRPSQFCVTKTMTNNNATETETKILAISAEIFNNLVLVTGQSKENGTRALNHEFEL